MSKKKTGDVITIQCVIKDITSWSYHSGEEEYINEQERYQEYLNFIEVHGEHRLGADMWRPSTHPFERYRIARDSLDDTAKTEELKASIEHAIQNGEPLAPFILKDILKIIKPPLSTAEIMECGAVSYMLTCKKNKSNLRYVKTIIDAYGVSDHTARNTWMKKYKNLASSDLNKAQLEYVIDVAKLYRHFKPRLRRN